MEKILSGKVALVTGAGRGIGREIALLMAHHGASVVVNDLGTTVDGDGEDLAIAQEVVDQILADGGEAVAHSGSVTATEDAESMIELAQSTFGRLDTVVNNAGILRDGIFHKMSESDWDSVIAVHLKGAFNISRRAAPVFRSQGEGCFIHFTSTSGLIGNFGQANYMAAKMGIVGLSKGIALDMQRFNVRSNCIAPFAWGRMAGSLPEDTAEAQDRIEKARSMTASQQAPLPVFLASDLAANVSGQVFGVRRNELYVFSQHRPIRSVHRAEGWTPASIAEHADPALRSGFSALERSLDVFSWDPV